MYFFPQHSSLKTSSSFLPSARWTLLQSWLHKISKTRFLSSHKSKDIINKFTNLKTRRMLNKAVHSQLGKRAAERALSEQTTRNIVGHSPSAALRFNKRRRLSASVRPPDESATQIDSRQDSTAGKHSPSTAHKARTAKVESPLERQHPFYWELHQMLKDPASTSSDFYELKRRMADAKASIEVELSQMPK